MAICQLCEADIPEGHQVEIQGKGRRALNSIICPNCASDIEQTLSLIHISEPTRL